jgi:hypothetical protein
LNFECLIQNSSFNVQHYHAIVRRPDRRRERRYVRAACSIWAAAAALKSELKKIPAPDFVWKRASRSRRDSRDAFRVRAG